MIRHIITWTLAASAPEQKQADAEAIKARIEHLNGLTPGVRSLRVGINNGDISGNSDLVLVSEFDSMEALHEYRAHPDHVAVGPFVRSLTSSRMAVDYEF